jgi:hypothetical protein
MPRRTWPEYELLGQNSVNPNWSGAPVTLQVNDSVSMPQTPNGSMVLAYFNRSTENNLGTLTYTSGGSQPEPLVVPALAKQPSILVQNWMANNLNLTNTSANSATPIWVEAFGPGLPGQSCLNLTVGKPITISTTQCATGTASPNWMQLVFTSNTANLSVLAIIGGPQDSSGNNAYVIALNSPSGNTGPGTGAPPPPGFYATTSGNAYTYQFNWGSSTLYVANMSPATAAAVQVTLRPL